MASLLLPFAIFCLSNASSAKADSDSLNTLLVGAWDLQYRLTVNGHDTVFQRCDLKDLKNDTTRPETTIYLDEDHSGRVLESFVCAPMANWGRITWRLSSDEKDPKRIKLLLKQPVAIPKWKWVETELSGTIEFLDEKKLIIKDRAGRVYVYKKV